MLQRLEGADPTRAHGESSYEYLVISLSPGESLSDARSALREHSELGRWELARTLIYQGGARRYWMRRRVMRVESSLGPAR
ncbi:DUF5703 family protein [Galactobacter valiniphilus]|uniref:DUF5703 family protein n=1 Tax=Galactobacter valiniphilus TaxID=2676122 RepID=UPI003736AC4A